ncbi:GDP-mannose 4,6-dehydratase [Luminiphilus sp.]|nr:GDP-mannose 4,6-dehydratase [Luminiphilus sp.]
MKRALITGITGQDGSYLAEFLLEKGYEVHGLRRRTSGRNDQRIEHLINAEAPALSDVKLHYGDMTDSTSILRLMADLQPDEVYNLAAQSHVHVSFDSPEYTANADAIGPLRILEAVRLLGGAATTRFYQASTSELYGLIQEPSQSETTPFYPRSPYAVAKLYAYWITINYREAYGLYACNGILFNHESPRRGDTFVTRKITLGIAAILSGKISVLKLGNIDAERDWGHARDYVEMQWLMLQQNQAEDYVIATGHKRSVRGFIETAFSAAGIKIEWNGEGSSEVGLVAGVCDSNLTSDEQKNRARSLIGSTVIAIDEFYYRPTEVDVLLGDASKARQKLGWVPSIGFEELVVEMMEFDLRSS